MSLSRSTPSASPATDRATSGQNAMRLRELKPTLNHRGLLVIAFSMAWVFAGAFVYWLKTGSTTIGVGGTLTNLGALIMFGPFFLSFLLFWARPIGPLRVFYWPPVEFLIDDEQLAWQGAGLTPRAVTWSELGGAAAYFPWEWSGTIGLSRTTLYTLQGEQIQVPGGWFRDLETGQRANIPDLIVRLHPERYELLPAPLKPGDACALKAGAGEARGHGPLRTAESP